MSARDTFVAERRERWEALEKLLESERNLHALPAMDISRTAALYRSLCADLMRARSLDLGADITGHLDVIASRAHNALYGPEPYRFAEAYHLVRCEFPRSLRKNGVFFLASFLLFALPLALGLAGALSSREFALSVLPPDALENAAESYADGFAGGRDGAADSMMAGFYVYNNVGIAFRCFATGALFGLGSVFFLIYNGLVIGTVVGHVIASGGGTNILTFICGHAPFELTAIVISGAAGLRLGWALIATHGQTRLGSLRSVSRELLALIAGAAVMLLIAAVIEGYWSPSSVTPKVKWVFAATVSLAVIFYLSAGGRSQRRASSS